MNRLLIAPLLLAVLAAGCEEGEANRSSDAAVGAAQPVANLPPTTTFALPALTGRIVDGANILSPTTEKDVGARLAALEAKTSDQVVVVTVPTLRGETIEAFSMRLGNGWGVGRKDLGNGVLLIVVPGDRKTRIGVGKGLEGLLTNARSAEIVEGLVARFKDGKYDEGVATGVGEIIRTLESETRRPIPLIVPSVA
ncbi:MAG: TPM domain-containing protein [Allosphingosinicella sp.]